MKGSTLKIARKSVGMTQVEAANRFGVSQTYLSLLENEERTITDKLARKAVRLFDLSPAVLPLSEELLRLRPTTNEGLVKDLASLKYPGFSHVSPSKVKNPAAVLLKALSADNLEARLVEALPWLLLKFLDMEWNVLRDAAKVEDLQNRLGFLSSLAKNLALKMGDPEKALVFTQRARDLEKSRLMKEDTLCRENMTKVERDWLRKNRSPEARYWNILSDLNPSHLSYAK